MSFFKKIFKSKPYKQTRTALWGQRAVLLGEVQKLNSEKLILLKAIEKMDKDIIEYTKSAEELRNAAEVLAELEKSELNIYSGAVSKVVSVGASDKPAPVSIFDVLPTPILPIAEDVAKKFYEDYNTPETTETMVAVGANQGDQIVSMKDVSKFPAWDELDEESKDDWRRLARKKIKT